MRLDWRPDIDHLDSDAKLRQAIRRPKDNVQDCVQDILDLAAHKRPNLRVLEVNLTSGQDKSFWLSGSVESVAVRATAREYSYASDRPESVLSAQDLYSQMPTAHDSQFTLLPITNQSFEAPPELSNLDLVLVRTSRLSSAASTRILTRNAGRLLAQGGTIIVQHSNVDKDASAEEQYLETLCRVANSTRFARRPMACSWPKWPLRIRQSACDRSLVILHLSSSRISSWSKAATNLLRDKGWSIMELELEEGHRQTQQPTKAAILVMDEVHQPLFATATQYQLEAIQNIAQQGNHLLWVTQGSQMQVSSPLKAVCHGVFRSVRAEQPGVRIATLDVESAAMERLGNTVEAIHTALLELKAAPSSLSADSEFVERAGLLHISRLRRSQGVDRPGGDNKGDEVNTFTTNLHSTKATIGLISQRLGRPEALQFAELGNAKSLLLDPRGVEVEIFASHVDGDDYATAIGSVPGEPVNWVMAVPASLCASVTESPISASVSA